MMKKEDQEKYILKWARQKNRPLITYKITLINESLEIDHGTGNVEDARQPLLMT